MKFHTSERKGILITVDRSRKKPTTWNLHAQLLRGNWAEWLCLLLGLFTLPAALQAQFTSTTKNGTVTITAYTGAGGDVVIPGTINGRPVTAIGESAFVFKLDLTSITIPNSVTSIGDYAFLWCRSLKSVTIPGNVTNIGNFAFQGCDILTSFTVDADNPAYTSADGVLFDKAQSKLIQCPPAKAGDYTIPSGVSHVASRAFHSCIHLVHIKIPRSVTSMGIEVFIYCPSLTAVEVDADNPAYRSLDGVLFDKSRTRLIYWPLGNEGEYTIPDGVLHVEKDAFYGGRLTSLTIPSSVTGIGETAFYNCHSLNSVYFLGNAPSVAINAFGLQTPATVYYLPGTTGWPAKVDGRPTEFWSLPYPVILTSAPGFGPSVDGFEFLISWATDAAVVVEASSDLGVPLWVPVSTNTLTGGTSRFIDPQWTNHPTRYYRVVSP